MTNLDTEPAPLPPPTPVADHHDRRWARSDDRVVLGVAGGLGRALAIDPLVIRIAFVVLALFSGVGVVLYVAALLLLADSPSSPPSSTFRRIAGSVVILLAARWLFSGNARLPAAGWVVAIGLLGIAVAVWRGRSPLDVRSAPPAPEVLASAEGGATTDRWETWTQRRDRPRPPRSALGLLTIGAATFVGALVWLVGSDNSRGAQAFGWATVVLGAGLLVGTFAGRARWLIIPALLTSVAAVGAAALSFAGASIDHRSGSRTEFIGVYTQVLPRYSTGLGDFNLELFDFPSDASTSIDVGVGKLTVDVPDDARVQIDARVGVGSIDALGSTRSGYRRSLSVDDNQSGAHLIKLTLRVGVGSIEVRRGPFFGGPPDLVVVPTVLSAITPAITPDIPVSKYFGDGTVLFEDGSIDFGDGRRIEANGSYQIPIVQQLSDGSVQLDNGAIVRADGTVVTPGGFVIPHQVQGLSTAPSTAAPQLTAVVTTTSVPTTVTSGVQP
ncbi:MAG: PspC domain-containing protein [Ilumatobacteraceae bacterium]|nr:PspC domain-containing protein [Ilumatobacteraceae bacterium]